MAAVLVTIADLITRRRLRNLKEKELPEFTLFLPDGNEAGSMKAGLTAKELQIEGLTTPEIIESVSKNRDAAIILSTVPLTVLPVVINAQIADNTQWILLAIIFAITLTLAGVVMFSSSFYSRARVWVFGVTSLVGIIINLVLGSILGLTTSVAPTP
ncbi:hypothetical protein [Gordonia namibiensis]|uniref:hypothetical protein n=1 Tax=Gordonia namibiensis TaxID=168480 RepID=UPI0012F6BB64|nr:hypothetical protein [Gordonia namibiensis]